MADLAGRPQANRVGGRRMSSPKATAPWMDDLNTGRGIKSYTSTNVAEVNDDKWEDDYPRPVDKSSPKEDREGRRLNYQSPYEGRRQSTSHLDMRYNNQTSATNGKNVSLAALNSNTIANVDRRSGIANRISQPGGKVAF